MADLINEKHQSTNSVDTPKRSQDLECNIILGKGDLQDPMFKHADPNDGDEALKAFAGHEGEVIVLTPEMEKKLLRKIDWNLMPLLCIVYGLNFLDKITLSFTSVMGLKTSLGLTTHEYQWLGSMFFVGYVIFEYPTSVLLQRLPLAKWSAVNIIAWGATLCCLAATTNFEGALAVRFFLGFFEASVTPGFALFTSQWYTKEEQGLRTGIWVAFDGIAQVFGAVFAYSISVLVKKYGAAIYSWQILFLSLGLLTSVMGCLFLYYMPDSQLNAKFLSPQERLMAIERIRKNQQGVGNKHFKFYQFKEALTDPITWAFTFYSLLANIPNGGLSNFFPQLIVSFGFTPDESLLYSAPSGVSLVIALVTCGYLGDKYGHRLLISIPGLLISTLGMALIAALPLSNSIGRLMGWYLVPASITSFVAILSMISSNVAGYTKKTTVAALYLIGYCLGNIFGPQIFRAEDAPRYQPAEIIIILCHLVGAVDVAFIAWYYNRMNKKKEVIRAAPGYKKLDKQEFLDLTDRENHEFVYSL
ncbi:hypothetical protein DSL72_002296 [Monilinia vaccinii-corymbosi]|uniref:Major facilitator superfamily (MFS) profile domain-containing protein n=1 Tax=Monilinia vaccinii-corymbosi TaxID=61207 RepID=A0A8A3PC85_9HELO|nr:hypothetical protein DSL72_002296 [Monilinia vaccinii-corymbosi]